ncbi:DUF1616 domain-containing protein [Natrinema sp. 74]|uniref:DUF1616 domain-containing protein n=1 Tax=Natrinema sp. 74 TaxID=3384159 RepID=UPI0038D444F6
MKGLPIQPFEAVRRRSKAVVAGLPVDLLGVIGFVVTATSLLAVADVSSSLIRAGIGVPLLFFAPGYVTVSALYPRKPSSTASPSDGALLIRQSCNVAGVERVALSFGLSFALLPLLGLAIAATPWGYTGPGVVGTVAGFAVVGAVLATVRRASVPPADRYGVELGRRLETARASLFGAESSIHVAVNVALVLAVALALTTVGYAFVSPQDGEQYTSLRLLSETDSGDLVASDYPAEIEPGESVPLVVAIENREETAMNYTAVVQQQRLEDGDVVERTELQRFEKRVGAGSTEYDERNVTPTADEGPVRISVLLYTDDVPETPTHENAYRYTHVWTNVTETDAGDDTGGGGSDTGASGVGTGDGGSGTSGGGSATGDAGGDGEDAEDGDLFDDLFGDEGGPIAGSTDGGTGGGTDAGAENGTETEG